MRLPVFSSVWGRRSGWTVERSTSGTKNPLRELKPTSLSVTPTTASSLQRWAPQLITHSPSVAVASPYCLLSYWAEFLRMIHRSRVSLPVFVIIITLLLCPTVYPVELHPQESVWAVQKNRKLLLPGHISSSGESRKENQKREKNLIRSFLHQTNLFLLAYFMLIDKLYIF